MNPSPAFQSMLVSKVKVTRSNTVITNQVVYQEMPCTAIDPASDEAVQRVGIENFADLFETRTTEAFGLVSRGDILTVIASGDQYSVLNARVWAGSHISLLLERTRSRDG